MNRYNRMYVPVQKVRRVENTSDCSLHQVVINIKNRDMERKAIITLGEFIFISGLCILMGFILGMLVFMK